MQHSSNIFNILTGNNFLCCCWCCRCC